MKSRLLTLLFLTLLFIGCRSEVEVIPKDTTNEEIDDFDVTPEEKEAADKFLEKLEKSSHTVPNHTFPDK